MATGQAQYEPVRRELKLKVEEGATKSLEGHPLRDGKE